MASGSLDIVVLSARALMLSCCRTLILAYDHDIMLAWHHAPMISCSHNRGVIMILHFPSPTPSCPHAPSLLQPLTCKETLPHCLASRSLIVQVSREAHFRGDVSRAGANSPNKGSPKSRTSPRALKEAPRALKEVLRELQTRSKSIKRCYQIASRQPPDHPKSLQDTRGAHKEVQGDPAETERHARASQRGTQTFQVPPKRIQEVIE